MALVSLQLLLRPIARLCLRRSWHIQDLVDAAKTAFILEGQRELRARGEEPNISKLAAMTGMHRRDVMRFHKEEAPPQNPRGLVSRILGTWTENELYCTRPGTPAVLTISGTERSFSALVASVSKDLHPGTILAELERVGVISRSGDSITLERHVHIVSDDQSTALSHAAADVSDLLASVESNIVRAQTALHATTHYDNIPARHVEELRQWLLQQGARIHREARSFLAKFDRDVQQQPDDQGGRVRVAFGTFGIVEDYEEKSK